MSNNEIFKLKKELQMFKEKIDELKQQNQALEEKYILVCRERDENNQASFLLEKLKNNVSNLIQDAETRGRDEERTKNERNIKDLDDIRNLKEIERKKNNSLEEELKIKNIELQRLNKEVKSKRRVEEGASFSEGRYDQEQKAINETIVSLTKKNEQERQKFSQLSEKMDNILAENRVLRRLAQVPENFGFNLEEIKIAERHQIEDYKASLRNLERINEELEGERLQLRNRLRILSNMYDTRPNADRRFKNMTKEQLEEVDNYALKIVDPLSNKTFDGEGRMSKEKEAQFKDLQERVKQCEREHGNLKNDSGYYQPKNYPTSNLSNDDIQNIIKQNKEMKEMLDRVTELLKVMSENGGKSGSGQPGSSDQNQLRGDSANLARPPQPMPGSFGNWDDISQVRSFKFKQMVPADIFELYSGAGFDSILAKYQITQLQVMNLESMRMLKIKEEEYSNMEGEVEELKEKLRKCLGIENNLYETYYIESTKFANRETILRTQLDDKAGEVSKLKEELEEYRNMNKLHMENDKNKQLQKIAELTQKISILDVNLIKISRKYSCLKKEYDEINESYKNMSCDFSLKEQRLIEKIHNLIDWKNKASHYMKVLLKECQTSIPKTKHNILRNKFEKVQDDNANLKEKNTDLNFQIQRLKSSERELDEKTTKIRIMEDEMVELQLESEMIKKMLEMSDPHFKKYQEALQKLVNVMQKNGISPMQVFSQIDDNRDGKLNPIEFQAAMKKIKVDFNKEEVDILFRFMDFDGNNKIELKEFSRKLRRQGLAVRKSQEQIIFNLWEKMKQAGLTISDTFQAFDKDRSGEVTKEEMQISLKTIIQGVDDDTIDYVFKIADTSGDGKITYSEFHALFENIIQDVMRQEMLMTVEELSWQKKLVLSIDEAIHQQGQYIKDLYNYIDSSGDEKISFIEFKGLFDNLKIEIEEDKLKLLFKDIDRDGNNYIEYNELINYIRQAKVEKTKIKKMKRVSDKMKEMQKQGKQYNEVTDIHEVQSLPREARLEMKISLMEIKEKNLLNRSDTLMYSLNLSKKENARIQMQLNERENEILTQMKKFNEEHRLNYKLKNLTQGCETKQRAKQIHNLNKKLLKENVELKSQNKVLKDLHEFSSNQVKDLLITLERKKFETQSLTEAIKDLQSLSDEKAIVGTLQHSLMVSRYNQAQVNIKYDHLIHDLEKQYTENNILESELGESRNDANEALDIVRTQKQDYENQITELRLKIFPTINMGKIDEMYSRNNELSSMKMNLEMQNKKLRDENHELAIKCDYFEALEQQFDTLKEDLKSKYSDELQHRIIELSMQVSEQRLLEMKAKRDQELAKEKEEYFSRVTRQHLEHVKQLENELENVNKKFNERETFWRSKHQEAMEMVMNDKVAKEKDDEALVRLRRDAGKTNKLVGVVRLNKESKPEEKAQKNLENATESEIIQQFKSELKEAKDREMQLKDENDRLIKLNKEIQMHSNIKRDDYQPSRVSQNTAYNEEQEKLAQAAQKTISTYQGLIDDKNHELERKDLLIEKMKRDFRTDKEKDSLEIRRLISQIHNNPQGGNASVHMQASSYYRNNEYWDGVGGSLDEKDKHIQQLNKYKDELELSVSVYKKQVRSFEDKAKQLEDELIIERKNNKTSELEAAISRKDKLLKQKTNEQQVLRKQFDSLASDYKKSTEDSLTQEEQQKHKILEVKKENKDLNERYEILNKSVKDQKKQLEAEKQKAKDLQNQNDRLERELKKEKQNNRTSVPTRVETENQNVNVNVNKEQTEKTKLLDNIKKLETEKKELQEKIDRLIRQKYQGLFDDEQYLIPYRQLNFQTAEDVALQIRKFFKQTPSLNFIEELKNKEEKIGNKQSGNILSGNLKKIFEFNNLKIKKEDFDLFIKPAIVTSGQRFNQQAPDQQPLNIVTLYYLTYNLVHAQEQADQPQNLDEKGRGSIYQANQSDGFKPHSTQEKFGQAQQFSGQSKKEEELLKRNDMLKAQVNNLRDEKDKIQKQLNLKSEQCKSLEQQLSKQLNKTGFENVPPSRRSGSLIGRAQGVEGSSELKDMIFELEDEKNNLNAHIRTKDLELKKIKEEKAKLEELLKEHKVQNLKLNNQIESLTSTKIHPDDLKQNIILEKDLLIKDIKDKLDKQRRTEQDLVDQLYTLDRENKELKFVKEQFDVQIQRLNRRIGELEEDKRASSPVKGNQTVNQQTLKKQLVPKK